MKKSSSSEGIPIGPSVSRTVVSTDEEDRPKPSKLTRKRCFTSDSSESNVPTQVASISIDVEDLVPMKKRRLRRRSSTSDDGVVNGDDDTDQLVDEVDEKGVFKFNFLCPMTTKTLAFYPDILDSRLRSRTKKSSYQKNLEKLKR